MTKKVQQLTHHTDFPVLDLGAGGGKLIYEQAGHLHLFDPGTNKSARLTISAPTDLVEARSRFVKGAKYIRAAGISPSGMYGGFETISSNSPSRPLKTLPFRNVIRFST